MSLKDSVIKTSYAGKGAKILHDFLLPSLNSSIKYDRISGFFTFDSLISIANGIDSIRIKNGKMRLIIGIHSIPEELLNAVYLKEELSKEIENIHQALINELDSFDNLLLKKKIATLAWMMDTELLEVKTAAVIGEGLFHPKTIILKDEEGNEVAAVGSPNETRNGLGSNFEQLMIATSWNNPDAVKDQKDFFDSLWYNKNKEAIVLSITKDLAIILKNSLGEDYTNYIKTFKTLLNPMELASNMPVNFFVSGKIPSLFTHQERAVIDSLSRWPVRALLSDEVGLGKTFEAASILTFLNTFCNVKRVLILTPKSVLKQWQDELYTNFNIYAWMYDSTSKSYIGPDNKTFHTMNSNPLSYSKINIILMSAQYSRGTKKSQGLLLEPDTILPELLIVDEAHSARISLDLSGKKKKTKMYKMLEAVCRKIPHLLLATATPMQKNSFEYHAMLKLLGLPKIWDNENNFLCSLKYIVSDYILDLSDAYKIAGMFNSTIKYMQPDTSFLTSNEQEVLDNIILLFKKGDKYNTSQYIQKNWLLIKPIFIKLHPARLLTIRNTRSSLAAIGYKFPIRNLHEKSIDDSNSVKMFYQKLYRFLNNECFTIEQELYPDRRQNVSFIKISYQQRMTSSLHSCKLSLNRRLAKIRNLRRFFSSKLQGFDTAIVYDDFDDFDFDETFSLEFDFDNLSENINRNNLKKYIDVEELSLIQLIDNLSVIIEKEGDKKIEESIKIALDHVKLGDAVLLFSRYTDTVDSLLEQFNSINSDINYAIYTGNQSVLNINGNTIRCSKEQIKSALNEGLVQIVFCSDAASEGLNLQAARVLINVDVPWTPSRLEQRIGRIARLGQAADSVDIYNVWYPDSVEAKMYTRIQNRLKDANISIGEFPDVVAENIKSAILNNTTDDSVNMLNSIRRDLQTDALKQLWSLDNYKTDSDLVRESLIKLLCHNFNNFSFDSIKNEFVFPIDSKGSIILTSEPGKENSINLFKMSLFNIEDNLQGLDIIKTPEYPIAFINSNNNYIKLISILGYLISNKNDFEAYNNYPVSLPDSQKLNLSYAIDCPQTDKPKYWPSN